MQHPMNRRSFVRHGVAGAAGAAIAGVSVRARSNKNPGESVHAVTPASFELDEATIAELQSGMSAGKYTAHSLARKYLDRIDEVSDVFDSRVILFR